MAEHFDDGDEIGIGMTLIEPGENRVVNRFDGAGHEQASGIAERPQVLGVLEQVIDLDRHVVGEARMFAV